MRTVFFVGTFLRTPGFTFLPAFAALVRTERFGLALAALDFAGFFFLVGEEIEIIRSDTMVVEEHRLRQLAVFGQFRDGGIKGFGQLDQAAVPILLHQRGQLCIRLFMI